MNEAPILMADRVRYTNGPPKFAQWLYYATDRTDDVGRVARFVLADHDGETPCWPMAANTVRSAIMHIRHHHRKERGAPTEPMLRAAHREYLEFVDSGGKVPVRPGGIRKSGVQKRHRGYVITEETVDTIRDLALAEGVTQGVVIERAIAAEAERVGRRAKRPVRAVDPETTERWRKVKLA